MNDFKLLTRACCFPSHPGKRASQKRCLNNPAIAYILILEIELLAGLYSKSETPDKCATPEEVDWGDGKQITHRKLKNIAESCGLHYIACQHYSTVWLLLIFYLEKNHSGLNALENKWNSFIFCSSECKLLYFMLHCVKLFNSNLNVCYRSTSTQILYLCQIPTVLSSLFLNCPSGFCVQCEWVQSGSTPRSADPGVATGIHCLWLDMTVM